MSIRGTKPDPEPLRVIEGGIAAGADADGALFKASVPEPPQWLQDDGLDAWEHMGPQLAEAGLLCELYAVPLAQLCQQININAHAARKLEAGGYTETLKTGYVQQSVWLQIFNKSSEAIRMWCNEFGVTPSALTRVQRSAQRDLFEDDFDSHMAG